MRDANYGARDFLKLRLRIRRRSVPSVAEIVILGMRDNPAQLSSVCISTEEDARRELDS